MALEDQDVSVLVARATKAFESAQAALVLAYEALIVSPCRGDGGETLCRRCAALGAVSQYDIRALKDTREGDR